MGLEIIFSQVHNINRDTHTVEERSIANEDLMEYVRLLMKDIIENKNYKHYKPIRETTEINVVVKKYIENEKVDDETMGFTIAVELASLTEKNQKTVLDAMESTLGTPNLSQAIRIKKLQEDGNFSQEKIEELLSEIKQKDIDRVVFKNEQLYRYFPSYYTAEQMKREILTLLKINMTFE